MSPDLQPIFRALADPTRRRILVELSAGELSIADVACRFSITRPAVKKHLTVLEEGGLISVSVRGRERINRLRADALRPAVDWLAFFDDFWNERLAALAREAESHDPPTPSDPHNNGEKR